MGISQKNSLTRASSWRFGMGGDDTKSRRIARYIASLLNILFGFVLLLTAQAGLAANIPIAGGYDHTIAIKPDGSLWAWGDNDSGRLGDGTTIAKLAPVQIGTSTDYSSIATTLNGSAALKTNGSLWVWGNNTHGELGNGTTTAQFSPVQIGVGYSAMAPGYYHTVALKADGSLFAWGQNTHGQLGDGTTVDRLTPVQVGAGYIAMAAGGAHTLALKHDGSLWAWGENTFGQLGDGTTTDRLTPVLIGTGFSTVSAGDRHTVALKPDGSLWAWGYNGSGQLGDGTTTTRLTPIQIGTGFSAIVSGGNHMVALKPNGSLWAWGDNNYGQLGDGTSINRFTPIQISTGFTLIGAGHSASYAAKADGSLWTWGSNLYGQLGDGTKTNRAYPTSISFALAIPPDVTAPTTPSDLTAIVAGPSQINLTWTAATDNVAVTAYKVYRGGTLLATLGNVTSYSSTGLSPATAYSYTVAACDAAGNCSAQSAATSATTAALPDTTAPAIPVAPVATVVSASQINLTWTASTDNVGVTVYKVYRDGVLLATLGNVTSYSDSGLAAATAYSYTLVACDAAGNCSANSVAGAATTSAAAGTLTSLAASCPATLASTTNASCSATASYSNGTSKPVSVAWISSNSAVATIDAAGLVTAASVTVNTPVTFTASYTENGVSRTASATITVTPATAQSSVCSGTAKYLSGISITGSAAKKAGESLDVNYCLKNFGKVSRFDIYVAVELPDHTLLYMRSGDFFGTPIFTSSVTPYLRNTLVPDLSGLVLSMPELPLELPLGSYTFYAVPVLAGKPVSNTANWIGQISKVSFTLGW